MANFDFEGLLSNPAFQMGLGILGNNNTENTAQVLGRGGLMGLQNYQQQKQRDDFNKIRQSQVDVMKQRQDREDSELEMQKQVIAEASAKFPDQALLFQLDPQAAVKALYPQANQQDPYFTPVYDSERGLGSFNARTGETSWQGGQPIIKPEHDPRLQGDLAYSKQFGKGRATPTDMEDGVIQTEAQLIKRLSGGLPSDVPKLPQGQPQSNAWQIPPEVQAKRDIAAKELLAAEGGQGDLGVTPPMPYNLPRGGGIRVPTKAEEAAQVKKATMDAETQQKAITDLPNVLSKAERSIKYIDEMIGSTDGKIKPHPGFESYVGATLKPFASKVHGTDEASFKQRELQLSGSAFLEAFESLKGGGHITEIEGEKATQAIQRMNNAVSEDEYIAAGREFQDILRSGITKAKSAAGVSASNSSNPKAGDIVDGYKFKGGNPSDPNNWEEQ